MEEAKQGREGRRQEIGKGGSEAARQQRVSQAEPQWSWIPAARCPTAVSRGGAGGRTLLEALLDLSA